MIDVYILNNGEKRYSINTYLGIDELTGKQVAARKKGYKTKRAAKNEETRLKMEFDENGGPLTKKSYKFEEIAEDFFERYEKEIESSTFYAREKVFYHSVLPFFKGMKIEKINTKLCQKYVDQLAKNYVDYQPQYTILNGIFKEAVRFDFIASNPLDKVLKTKSTKVSNHTKDKFWDKDELIYFLNCLDASDQSLQTKTYFRLVAYSGMRREEMSGLRWHDIDFKNKNISIRQVLVRTKKGEELRESTKTDKSKRTISMDVATLKMLRKLKVAQMEQFMALGITAESENQTVFVTPNSNRHLYLGFASYKLGHLQKKFNIKNKINLHGFRHTHCTLLFESGATIKEAQDRMGHADVKTTMNIYTHVTKSQKEKTADKFINFMTTDENSDNISSKIKK